MPTRGGMLADPTAAGAKNRKAAQEFESQAADHFVVQRKSNPTPPHASRETCVFDLESIA